MQECSLFSTPSPAFIVCRLFDDGHSDWCEVIFHCSFHLHFSNNERCWASFHVFISHLYVFFVKVFSTLFDWVVCFFWYWIVWVACIFWKLILCQLFHLLLFSPFWGLFFHFAYSFLCYAKAFKFNRVQLVYFCFYFHYSRRWVIKDFALTYVVECSAYIFL